MEFPIKELYFFYKTTSNPIWLWPEYHTKKSKVARTKEPRYANWRDKNRAELQRISKNRTERQKAELNQDKKKLVQVSSQPRALKSWSDKYQSNDHNLRCYI